MKENEIINVSINEMIIQIISLRVFICSNKLFIKPPELPETMGLLHPHEKLHKVNPFWGLWDKNSNAKSLFL